MNYEKEPHTLSLSTKFASTYTRLNTRCNCTGRQKPPDGVGLGRLRSVLLLLILTFQFWEELVLFLVDNLFYLCFLRLCFTVDIFDVVYIDSIRYAQCELGSLHI